MSPSQIKYAASDVLYLHQIKEKLDEMLEKNNRKELFNSCVKFLPTRCKLDLEGFDEIDIFAH